MEKNYYVVFSAVGNPELWPPGTVEVLIPCATNLMKAIAELLKATERATVTGISFVLCAIYELSYLSFSLYRRL